MPADHRLMAITLATLTFAIQASEPVPEKSPAYGVDKGKADVIVVESLKLRDEKRKSELVVRLHHPKGDGPFPIIVFSHGFGAGKDAFAAIAQHWASHGYVTIHPNHADGGRLGQLKGAQPKKNNDSDPDNRREELRNQLQEQHADSEKKGAGRLGGIGGSGGLSDRVRDIVAVLDALNQIEEQVPALKGKLAKDKIAVSGHSFGAATVMLIGGITADIDGEKAKSFLDARVKCVLPFSGSGAGEYGLTKDSFKSSRLPTLYVTGTKDIRPGKEFEWRREAFEGSPSGDKYLVIMDGATHFHFGGGPPGGSRLAGIGGNRGGDQYTPHVKDVSLAFFDAYLKGIEKAKVYLSKDGFGKHAAGTASIESK
jgi:predicted dienelactone hydrolase